ncbi:hypothetical protein PC117_g14800 [Phytophthora cactorum]|uniref:Uncharacterized protein n=1 Tax=Phytophthora cactorum TaxID=29920 RepID=A0A8T1CNB8_9STRA|nr:hypothetical protein PC117_g14800 [Phytophthora cactorum]
MPTSKTKELTDEEHEFDVDPSTVSRRCCLTSCCRPSLRDGRGWFCAAVEEYGRRVELVFQPPNNPDLNVLDLGLFTAT